MLISCNHVPVQQVVLIVTRFLCNSLQLMYSTGGILFGDYILDPKCSLGVATHIQYEFSNSSVQGKKNPQRKSILWEEEFYMYVMRNLFRFYLDFDLSLPSEVSQDTPIHSC